MKDFWASFGGQVAASLLPLAIVGIVGLLIWRKLFGANTATQVVDNTIQGAHDIAAGLPGLISDTLTGSNDSTYITQAQATQLAAQRLAVAQGRL